MSLANCYQFSGTYAGCPVPHARQSASVLSSVRLCGKFGAGVQEPGEGTAANVSGCRGVFASRGITRRVRSGPARETACVGRPSSAIDDDEASPAGIGKRTQLLGHGNIARPQRSQSFCARFVSANLHVFAPSTHGKRANCCAMSLTKRHQSSNSASQPVLASPP
ncbi:hypothetical protein AURDEDRAFT_165664 [Auricularia subglabra TFB-10046 SS5]|nr:hypothetical protein AURDEDRAFT_165664 [Auricularia subglabra TFB-10046 SS5]